MIVLCVLARFAGNTVQFDVGVHEGVRAPAISQGQYTGPHGCADAGAGNLKEAPEIGVIHRHTAGNQSNVGNAAPVTVVEPLLIRWDMLVYAGPAATTRPGRLADIGAILFDGETGTTDSDDVGGRGRILSAAAT